MVNGAVGRSPSGKSRYEFESLRLRSLLGGERNAKEINTRPTQASQTVEAGLIARRVGRYVISGLCLDHSRKMFKNKISKNKISER